MIKVTKIELTRGHQRDWIPTVSFTADLGANQTAMDVTLAPLGEDNPVRPDVDRLFDHCVNELKEVLANATQVIE
jgi:hypothetical protein